MTRPTFIHTYKPYTIKDFSNHTDFTDLLYSLVDIDQLNLLFIGEPNTGKTTLLNALVREYYQLSAEDRLPENNILHVNQLKEQGIQYFRNEMKTFCQSRTLLFGKKKMVLIDDIDSINEQSQHVFRNYIDKYRDSIHFICMCTNVQKVVESIQSRLHIVKIPAPTTAQISDVIDKIANTEGLVINPDAKEYLTALSGTSIRQLINHMEKIYLYGEPITKDICSDLCSSISAAHYEEYFKYLMQNELQKAVSIIYTIYDYGYSVIDILDYMFLFIKTTSLIDEETKYQMIPIVCRYITYFHNIHEDCIELALFTNNMIEVIQKTYA